MVVAHDGVILGAVYSENRHEILLHVRKGQKENAPANPFWLVTLDSNMRRKKPDYYPSDCRNYF